MKVWDLPTRLYHWVQVVLVMGLVATGYLGAGIHVAFGLALVTLLFWRIIWGIVGSETSRFTSFIRSPRRVFGYLAGRHKEQAGHNPAGGWMVISMLLILMLQCLSGLVVAGLIETLPFSQAQITDDLVESISDVHSYLAPLLLGLIGLHLLAIIIYKCRSKPLVWAMVVGVQHRIDEVVLSFESNKRACVVFIASVLVTIAIVAP